MQIAKGEVQYSVIILYKKHMKNKYFNYSEYALQRLYIEKLEVATRGVLWEKLFLEISQNSQENTCARVSFLIKISKNTFFKDSLLYLGTLVYSLYENKR